MANMMKRKFSFNIAPVKAPLKNDPPQKAASDQIPSRSTSHSHPHSHRRHQSRDSMSTLNSPYISRQRIDPRTEQELRAACALILQNFKPSDHGLVDADPKLDFQGMNRRRDREREQRDHERRGHKDQRDPREHREHRSERMEVRVRQPTGAPVQQGSAQEARKQHQRADVSTREQQKSHHRDQPPARANTGRRRADQHASTDKGKEHVRSPTNEHLRSANMRAELDSDDGKSVGTPLTGSTDIQPNNGSTAPTSAALTSGRNSKRESHQFESAAARADAQAMEWMRQEREKKLREQAAQSKPENKAPVQVPSRSKSIRSGIKEYIFPGSASLSRTQSHESLNTMHSRTSSQREPRRSGSSHGWRSWGLQRMASSRNSSRPGTSKGRIENQEQDKKPSINLNRELPPLPSLDSWKDQEQPNQAKENRRSQAQGAHIATVMRSPDQQQQEYAAAVRKHHRRSGSDTLALRYANSSFAHSSPHVGPVPPRRQASKASKQAPRVDNSMDFDDLMSAMKSTDTLEEKLRLGANGQAHQQSRGGSHSRSPSLKMSSDLSRLEAPPPNFSRKISADVTSPRNFDHIAYPNQVEIRPHSERQQESKSKLKKVLSGWMLRKEKKDDWMNKVEKNGIKNGVMIQDEAALPPVVRY